MWHGSGHASCEGSRGWWPVPGQLGAVKQPGVMNLGQRLLNLAAWRCRQLCNKHQGCRQYPITMTKWHLPRTFALETVSIAGNVLYDDGLRMYRSRGGVLFFYSSLIITQVKIYSSSHLINRWFPLLNFYLHLTRKQKFTIIMDFCQNLW